MPKIKPALFVLIFLTSFNSFSQQLQWRTLPNSPSDPTERFEDCYFINANTGWVVHITDGKIYKTSDGGNSWVTQYSNAPIHFRSIGFFDSLNGIAGLYTIPVNYSTPLFKTTNGGINWSGVQTLPAPVPAGICGICIVSNLVMYGCGKIDGPANVIKTTDGGTTWQSFNMTGIASRLVDCYFFSPDSGFVIGGIGSSSASQDVILFTSNGGNNWITRYTSSITGQNQSCWKISVIDRMHAYTSLNQANDSLSFLKTIDGGVTWIRLAYSITNSYFTQGIGFINSSTGWLGGDFTNPNTYKTTDGGLTWVADNFGKAVNRIHFLNDTLGYAVGGRVYKYCRDPIGINPISNTIPENYILDQNFPNPFNPSTEFKFEIPKESKIKIVVYDVIGNELAVLLDTYLSGGIYQVGWDGKDKNGLSVSSGLYFYRIEANDWTSTKKMVILK